MLQAADALPMDILQAAVPMLANHDPDIRDSSRDASDRMAVRLVAKLATVLAAWGRIRQGQEPIDPDPALGQGFGQSHMQLVDYLQSLRLFLDEGPHLELQTLEGCQQLQLAQHDLGRGVLAAVSAPTSISTSPQLSAPP